MTNLHTVAAMIFGPDVSPLMQPWICLVADRSRPSDRESVLAFADEAVEFVFEGEL